MPGCSAISQFVRHSGCEAWRSDSGNKCGDQISVWSGFQLAINAMKIRSSQGTTSRVPPTNRQAPEPVSCPDGVLYGHHRTRGADQKNTSSVSWSSNDSVFSSLGRSGAPESRGRTDNYCIEIISYLPDGIVRWPRRWS